MRLEGPSLFFSWKNMKRIIPLIMVGALMATGCQRTDVEVSETEVIEDVEDSQLELSNMNDEKVLEEVSQTLEEYIDQKRDVEDFVALI